MSTAIADFVLGYSWYAVLFLLLGILFLIVEIFTPGFGWAGITGFVCLMISIVLRAESLTQGLWMTAVLLILAGVLCFFFARSARKGKISKTNLVLKESVDQDASYSASNHIADYVGRFGTTCTALRPSGRVDFEGELLDVVADGIYIDAGTKVRVKAVEGRRVIVEPVR